ncbi:ammonium transporter [Hydrogenispora ethanolica]|uniref:Ammonium transporter n=1 Tax=Hydrogenispora ethanolica TaxID=1082276 RepID=A0A4R1S784_HYDET|nr:ammonium transporter [Hydrogenispora ethanolica]TCL75253.1 ammonium transporter [Hydrogenispora ethanolica]
MNTGDTAWILISSALVMLMTPALGLFYGGMVRKKNLLSTIMFSFSMIALISIQWIVYGYSLSFGPDVHGLIGTFKWLGLSGVGYAPNPDYATTIPHLAFATFQMMFAVITPALISGAFVERIKFSSFLIFSVLWATLVYNPVCHWVWALGGWIRNLGALDFAGGTVVHITAGFSALAFSMVIKKRKGFSTVAMEPNNVPFTVIGAALLWFGWFGFNGGSALGSNGLAVNAFLTTNTAAAAAGLTWMAINWLYRRPSAIGMATGAVVGLVSITPASGFVSPASAIVIGAVGAAISYFCIMIRNHWKIDESLDVWACHGMGGLWGAIATGIFASKAINPAGADGLLLGNGALLGAQVISAAVVIVFSFAVTYGLAKLIDLVLGLSVTDAEEQVGLDISQHGEEAYY